MQRGITIIVSWLGFMLVAAGLYLIILGPGGAIPKVSVAAVQAGDQEVAWLHPATNIATWERFVAGLKELPGITIDESAAFPEASMKLPVVGLRKANTPGTLWIRWYKLTGSHTIEIWVNQLCHRSPPPVAIVGGGNSERARDIADQLQRWHELKMQHLPLFLITTATADQVQVPGAGKVDLMQLYPQRSFRYCFTNRQMAESIGDFVRTKLKDDRNAQLTSQRVSLLSWQDDPFSEDLVNQFESMWKKLAGAASPPITWSHHMGHSVGGTSQPNRPELEAVQKLIQAASADTFAVRGRELLVLPGGPAPARRVLRTLYRADPVERHFWVVTVGDAIDWNSLYRDRKLSWPIEDAPFPLIAFMHRNPVDQKLSITRSFSPETTSGDGAQATGTDDLLLYRDIGRSLINAYDGSRDVQHAQDRLLQSLRAEHDEQGQLVFDADGNRLGQGSEYITLLQPLYDNLQLLPRSKIEVYERQATQQGTGSAWRQVISLEAGYNTVALPAGGQSP